MLKHFHLYNPNIQPIQPSTPRGPQISHHDVGEDINTSCLNQEKNERKGPRGSDLEATKQAYNIYMFVFVFLFVCFVYYV